jgi:hypothetical protein
MAKGYNRCHVVTGCGPKTVRSVLAGVLRALSGTPRSHALLARGPGQASAAIPR